MPDQHGRTAVISGGNTGLGFELARLLAGRGAAVVLACRSLERGSVAVERLRTEFRGAQVSVVPLDQGSLRSVREAGELIVAEHPRIDLLINNAGMLGSLDRRVSDDGFELTFATNHLGTFALTGLLMCRLHDTPGSRVVTMSSVSNTRARIDFSDLELSASYDRNTAYSRSKLANLMFAYALQSHCVSSGEQTVSLAAHPGQSRTEFTRDLSRVGQFLYSPRARWITGLVMQDKAVGVLAAARAATDPDALGGQYYGPSGLFELTGHPVLVGSNKQSRDRQAQEALWSVSEEMTGVSFPLPPRVKSVDEE